MGLLQKIAAYGGLGGAPGAYTTNKKFRGKVNDFFTGTPEKRENISLLHEDQEPLNQQLLNAAAGPGAGGAFGTAADYYRNLMSDDSADYNAFAAPALRQYNEDIVPGISEQFAGMGAGGLSSSGFRNAQVQGGVDLSERLGALRANLRQAGAQGLQNIGQFGLRNYTQNMVTEPGSQGLLGAIAPAIGKVAGSYFGGPAGGAAGEAAGTAAANAFKPQSSAPRSLTSNAPDQAGGFTPPSAQYGKNWLSNSFGANKVGMNTGPYGNSMKASPMTNPMSSRFMV